MPLSTPALAAPVAMAKPTADGQPLGDFVGLAILDGDTKKDLHFSNGFQFWNFAAVDWVVEALQATGVTDLSITRAWSRPAGPCRRTVSNVHAPRMCWMHML